MRVQLAHQRRLYTIDPRPGVQPPHCPGMTTSSGMKGGLHIHLESPRVSVQVHPVPGNRVFDTLTDYVATLDIDLVKATRNNPQAFPSRPEFDRRDITTSRDRHYTSRPTSPSLLALARWEGQAREQELLPPSNAKGPKQQRKMGVQHDQVTIAPPPSPALSSAESVRWSARSAAEPSKVAKVVTRKKHGRPLHMEVAKLTGSRPTGDQLSAGTGDAAWKQAFNGGQTDRACHTSLPLGSAGSIRSASLLRRIRDTFISSRDDER